MPKTFKVNKLERYKKHESVLQMMRLFIGEKQRKEPKGRGKCGNLTRQKRKLILKCHSE